jgi:hypothetical protein
VRVRIKPLPFIAFCTFSIVLGTFSGLAGFFSSFVSVLLPALFFASVLHLIVSWQNFAFHQNFSNDHPLKGESVRFSLSMSNESPVPAAEGLCHFADPGPSAAFARETDTPVRAHESRLHEAEIRCAWRGTYVIGLSSISFRDVTGMIAVEEKIEPRTFYVYPELVQPGTGIERLARSSGSDRPGANNREEDPAIFEYVAPLVPGRPARHIAWKRWAATGIPAEMIHGQARSSALTVVLDLWPGYESGTEKLASEDMAMSAAFSVLRYLARERIPAELVYGSHADAIPIATQEQFTEIFDQTTNVIFDDPVFPESAFDPGKTVLLVSTRPLIDYRKTMPVDLFTAYEGSLARGAVPHLLVCPPPARADAERRALESLAEIKSSLGVPGLLALADSRRGLEDLINALRY